MEKYRGLMSMIVAMIFFSCSQIQEQPIAKYEFEILPEDDTLKLSELYSSCKLVNLTDIIVSNITNVIILDSIYIVQCNAYSTYENMDNGAVVSLFSKDGNYLAPLIRIGRGPEDVLTIEDMCFNDKSGTLDVLCNYGQYIYRYDIYGRKPVEKIKLDQEEIIVANALSPISDSKYLIYKKYPYSRKPEYKLYVFNARTRKIESCFLEMNKKTAENLAFGQKNNLIKRNEDIYYYAAFEQYIYEFSEGQLSPFVKFRENRYSIPMKFLNKLSANLYNTIEELRQSQYIWGHVNMYYYSGNFMSSYTYSNKKYLSILNPELNISRSCSAIEDDMVMGIIADDVVGVYTIVGSNENGVCYVLEPYVLKEILSLRDSTYTEVQKQIMSAADDANPMLLIMK